VFALDKWPALLFGPSYFFFLLGNGRFLDNNKKRWPVCPTDSADEVFHVLLDACIYYMASKIPGVVYL
jgi:hypothetical protein